MRRSFAFPVLFSVLLLAGFLTAGPAAVAGPLPEISLPVPVDTVGEDEFEVSEEMCALPRLAHPGLE